MNKIIEHAANILVVDDHPIVRKGISALLCHTASYITEASCAAEAADISRTHNIDIAVIDIDLPDANGLELITRLLPPSHKCASWCTQCTRSHGL